MKSFGKGSDLVWIEAPDTGYTDKLQDQLNEVVFLNAVEPLHDGDKMKTVTILKNVFKKAKSEFVYTDQPGEKFFSRPGPDGRGDCDDFALMCYDACVLCGIYPGNLGVMVGKLDNGLGHAVTIYARDGVGQFFFDCRAFKLLPFDHYPFRPLFMIQHDRTWIAGKKQKVREALLNAA